MSASSRRPTFWLMAPVKAPFSWPKSSLSWRKPASGGAKACGSLLARFQVAAPVAVALDNARSYREIAQLTDKLAVKSSISKRKSAPNSTSKRDCRREPGAEAGIVPGENGGAQRRHGIDSGRDRNREGADRASHSPHEFPEKPGFRQIELRRHSHWTVTTDGFFAATASIIGSWPGDGRVSRSRSNSRLPAHRSNQNNDLRLNKPPRSRSGRRLNCPVGEYFSNSRRSRILGTGRCLKSPFRNWTNVSHAWVKSMVWLSLNISEV